MGFEFNLFYFIRQKKTKSFLIVQTNDVIPSAERGAIYNTKEEYVMKTIGPLQLTVIGFDSSSVTSEIVEKLRAVRENGSIRVIDLLFVAKDEGGRITTMETTDLTKEEAMHFGAVIGGLIGLGAAGEAGAVAGALEGAFAVAERDLGLSSSDIKLLADDLPSGSSALIVLFEHIWALELKEAIINANGVLLAQGLISPEALMGVGEELAACVEAAEEA